MLQLPSVQWTNTLEEAYEHLLQVHFPGCQAVRDTDSDPTDTSRAPSVYRWVPSTNWDTVDEVVTYDKLKRAIQSMAPYKSPGLMVYALFYYNGGLNISVLHGYTFTEHLLLWDIYLEYGNLPGSPILPSSREAQMKKWPE